MADGSDDITAAFKLVFGYKPKVQLMCYFYGVKNIDNYLKVLFKTQKSEELKEDLSALKLSIDDATFSTASILFLKK